MLHKRQSVEERDPRVTRTRAALRAALIALVARKPYDEIQIQEIAEEAGTARVTFYRHYATRDDLLLDCIDAIYAEIIVAVPPFEGTSLDLRRTPPTLPLFQYFDAHASLLKIVFSGPKAALIQNRIRAYIVERVVSTFSRAPLFKDVPIVLIAQHIASATIGNLIWWLLADRPYPAVYMARLSHSMSVSGALATIGRLDLVILPDPASFAPGGSLDA